MKTLRIGIDDTDSKFGMCTTYLAYRIVSVLRKRGDKIAEYPRLIRLNPNIPWKTRGNGAVGITVRTSDPNGAKRRIISMVKKYSDTINGANPGLVFLESDNVPDKLCEFAREALWRVIPRKRARDMAKSEHLECHWIGNGQGLVGAISAIGYKFADTTMELLAYRRTSNIGKPRRIEASSVQRMHERTFPHTFNSYDVKTKRVLIAPHGADPVLYGIRGEDAKTLIAASRTIGGESSVGHMIFVSNQGTGDHLANTLQADCLHAHESGMIEGSLDSEPYNIGGGHVRLAINSQGTLVDCFVYKPTGMGKIVRSLVRGDKIRIGGAIRRARAGLNKTLNVETIKVIKLVNIVQELNPLCNNCSKRMKSKGVGQNFKCIRCGNTARNKKQTIVKRNITVGSYVAQPSAQRHLSRPAHRVMNIARSMKPSTSAWIK